MNDYRIGKRVELRPATDRWMRGDKYGVIVSVLKRIRHYIDPRDPRNGLTFRVKMDRSWQIIRVTEGNIGEWIE
jgi:hypothetical protein